MKEKELSTKQHQQVLDVLHCDIDSVARQIFELQEKLGNGLNELYQLVEEYQRQRFRRQDEIWQSRGLTRCTICYDVPPNHTPSRFDKRIPTPRLGWGLMSVRDTRYVSSRGSHWHTSHESDYHHSHIIFHRLCSPCYQNELKVAAAREGGLHDLSKDQVQEIDDIRQSSQESWEQNALLRKKFGNFSEIVVRWHDLPIPEEAYEIGTKITQEMNWGGNRLVSLKPSPSGPR